MTAQEIRKAYLEFFKERGHTIIPRSLLVPQDDPTTLFTGSGMQPLIPYLLGQPHPSGNRLVDSQTCLRAQDIEEVGDNRHTTFFEMLGNWSLGNYFKKEQLPWFFEFLTQVVGLDPNKLFVSVFGGYPEHEIPKDEESTQIWKELFAQNGIPAKTVEIGSEENGYKVGEQGGRIFFYGDKNWWSREGAPDKMRPGEPGGPDSEVFYLLDNVQHDTKFGEHCHPNCDCGRYIEIGNSVFMEYLKTENGFNKLPKQNVDYGGGLERIAQAALNSPDMFKISLLWPIVEKLEELSGKKYDSHTVSMRVVADHLRGATFLAVDGVTPSNKEQGYVMRRLIRRAIRFAFELGIEQNFMESVVPVIADIYHADFPEVAEKREIVTSVLIKEEKAFRQTLRKGLKEFEHLFAVHSPQSTAHSQGEAIFQLYDTYGFPVELSVEEAFKNGIDLSENWRQEFDNKMNEQRQRSQTAAQGTFKGGLGGHGDIHKKYHTATHLMYRALREVLGDHVLQRGSNITEERTRFDFTHPEKMTSEQIKQVEDLVNERITMDLSVGFEELPTKEALDKGAYGAFGDKYGAMVKVYSMKDKDGKLYSFEICGGPHVDHTGQLAEDGKKFKITKEESSSAGVRRIKAVLI